MIRVHVLYPSSATRFDFDYYINKHLPLVAELWKPLGLIGVEAAKGLGGLIPGSAPIYVNIAMLTFPSLEVLQAVMTSASAPQVLGDIPNFTDAQPVVQISESIG